MVEHLQLRGLDLRALLRVVAQPPGQLTQLRVETAAQRVVVVGDDVGQERLQQAEALVEHPLVEPFGHPLG